MRKALDRLYDGCGVLAALSLILIGVFVLAQVVGRLFGVPVPGADDLAGYSMASSAFLGLAHTFNRGGHVRVTLMFDQFSRSGQRYLDVVALIVCVLVVGFFLWYTADLAMESAVLGEVSVGLLKIPTAIPQGFMALGVAALFIALIDALVVRLRGGVPSYVFEQEDQA